MSARRRITPLAGAMLLLGLAGPAFSADEHPVKPADVARVAAMIDRHIDKRLKDEAVTPAPIASDAEFLRRAYLSIAGRVPRVAEAHEFLADRSPDKRRKLVAELLETPGYITHFSTFWRGVMMPEVSADLQVRFLVPGFEAWLRDELRKGTPYDDMVKQILTAKIDSGRDMRAFYSRLGEANPVAFFQGKQAKPENLAAAVSRMFLGVRIECAQCHNHPFDTWKREQFWSFAAFFAGIQRNGNNVFSTVREVADRREIAIPNTDKVAQASFLDGKTPQFRFRKSARETLAEWVTAKDNPYFAKMTVNRIWHKLFGTGIVEPVDDFTAANSPSHPELLDELATEFTKHNYDLKFLIRAIAASKAYQRTSRKTHASQSNPQLFARMTVQALTPEQLFDSLATAVGYYQPFQTQNPFVFGRTDSRSEIIELFTNDSASPSERSATILQALAMMNGRFISGATSVGGSSGRPTSTSGRARRFVPNGRGSNTLAAVIDFPLADTKQRVETLFLATLSRKPTPDESARFVKYVESGGAKKDKDKALGDVFWALLNSGEFALNH
jgi:Protein of unknown function (DUF1549)/Protein of unknown function (DUF1553)